MAFPQQFMDELESKTDIAALIGQYVSLKRQGTRLTGLCPFHSEKTPSFSVSSERGMFYCFGCHAGGDAISFVKLAENLDYHEAVRFLAARAGLTVPEEGEDGGYRIRRDRVLEILRLAARWFYENLSKPEGRLALDYMETRGIDQAAARRFGLGAAPGGWDGLIGEMKSKNVSIDELHAAGLIARGQRGGMYDSFRNRLMFPIFDMRGSVIAFSGRALDDSPAKYKNSPETVVYKKRNILYAANYAKNSKKPYWILTEGNMDVFMLHQHGFDNTVATCGTALTDAQARIIARCTQEVVLAYDSDAAGTAATQKAITILENTGLRVRVLRMAGAKDPDEYVRKYGPAALEKLITASTNHMDYRLIMLEAEHDLTSDAGKIDFLKQATAMLAEQPGQSERQVYASRIADKIGVDRAAVVRDVETVSVKLQKGAKKQLRREVLRSVDSTGSRAEEIALAIVLAREDLIGLINLDVFEDETVKAALNRKLGTQEEPDDSEPDGVTALIARLTLDSPIPGTQNAEEALRDCLAAIEKKAAEKLALSGGLDPLMEKYRREKDKKRFGG